MALIKCPECGKEVSTSAETCPHCGFPIKQDLVKQQRVGPKPLNSSWLESWKKAPARRKWALTFVYFVNVLVFFVFLLTGLSYDEGFPLWSTIGIYITGFISIFTFSFWIAGFICLKSKTTNVDGYNVIAIAGIFHNYLVIENYVCERLHNRHLDGTLPNGRRVEADFAFWDSSIRISVEK